MNDNSFPFCSSKHDAKILSIVVEMVFRISDNALEHAYSLKLVLVCSYSIYQEAACNINSNLIYLMLLCFKNRLNTVHSRYYIAKYTQDMPRKLQRSEMMRAVQLWSEVAPIDFKIVSALLGFHPLAYLFGMVFFFGDQTLKSTVFNRLL